MSTATEKTTPPMKQANQNITPEQRKGYTYCGIIHLANGSERMVYQKTA